MKILTEKIKEGKAYVTYYDVTYKTSMAGDLNLSFIISERSLLKMS